MSIDLAGANLSAIAEAATRAGCAGVRINEAQQTVTWSTGLYSKEVGKVIDRSVSFRTINRAEDIQRNYTAVTVERTAKRYGWTVKAVPGSKTKLQATRRY